MAFCSAALALLLWAQASVLSQAAFSIQGCRLYRVDPFTQEAVELLRSLHDRHPSEPDPSLGLTFFKYPSRSNVRVDVLVPPSMVETFNDALADRPDVQLELLHRNYGRLATDVDIENALLPRLLLRQRRSARSGGRTPGLVLGHAQYKRYDQILAALRHLEQRCNLLRSGTCRLQEIGSTYEGRKLVVLRIEKSQDDKQKRKVWIDGGIHAREWISPATVLFLADMLISKGLSTQPRAWSSEIVSLLNYYDFMVLPLYNPDGYEYSHSHYRFWRKNRQPNSQAADSRVCKGVDLNRNYGYKWGGVGSSERPCLDNYRGAGPFSAMETAAVKRFLEQENAGGPRFLLFLSYHSYGQYVLMPFGYEKATYPQPRQSAEKMRCAAFYASREMFSKNHRYYIHGTSADVLYEASGGSDDWAHGQLGIPYSLTVELPDDGAYGFLLPPAYIANVGNEAVHGLLAALRTIHDLETNTNFYSANCPRLPAEFFH